MQLMHIHALWLIVANPGRRLSARPAPMRFLLDHDLNHHFRPDVVVLDPRVQVKLLSSEQFVDFDMTGIVRQHLGDEVCDVEP